VTRVDEAVLSTLGGDVLRPAVVMAILDGVFEAMNPTICAHDVDVLRSELAELERELARLTNAIAAGGELNSLLEAVKARQARRDELTTAIAARELFDLRRFDRKAIEAKVLDYVKAWRALLTKRVEDGRQLLREVLAGPLRFTPEGKTYRFDGEEAEIRQLLAGVASLPTVGTSPAGSDREWIQEFECVVIAA